MVEEGSNKLIIGFKPEEMKPYDMRSVAEGSIDEITGNGVLERHNNLPDLVDNCYFVLKVGGKATFTSPYFSSALAWAHPSNCRGISEVTLNFADKKWREDNKFDIPLTADFEVQGNFAVDQTLSLRSSEFSNFAMKHYNNTVQAIMLTLIKRAP